MDSEIIAEITAMVPMYQAWQILQFTQLAAFTALFYHYALTFDDEVSQIWPQPTWKMGKILFVATRYSAIIYMVHLLLLNWPHRANIGVPACEALGMTMNVAGMFSRLFAEGTLWLCLYALLGGKPKYFCFLVITFLAFAIPANTLNALDMMSQRAIPQNALDLLLGYPCNFLPPQRPDLSAISSYIVFARTSLVLLVGFVTLFVRYRKQNHNLIKVIRREGGLYYMSSLIIMFFWCLTSTPRTPVPDNYSILWSLKHLVLNVFADRLLLKMKKVDDRSTQAVISTLVFDHDGQSSSSFDGPADSSGGLYTDPSDVPPHGQAGKEPVVDTSEKVMGKRAEV